MQIETNRRVNITLEDDDAQSFADELFDLLRIVEASGHYNNGDQSQLFPLSTRILNTLS